MVQAGRTFHHAALRSGDCSSAAGCAMLRALSDRTADSSASSPAAAASSSPPHRTVAAGAGAAAGGPFSTMTSGGRSHPAATWHVTISGGE